MTTLALADFADKLKLASASWSVIYQQELSGLGGGQMLASDRGPAYWEADCSTVEAYHADIRAMRAVVDKAQGTLGEFYLYDPAAVAPVSDPLGLALAGATVKIKTVPDGRSLRLKGLPIGYVLTAGDLISFDTGSRRQLVQIGDTVTADGSGDTAAFAVSPSLLTGTAVDTVVTLLKPSAKMKLVPGSVRVSMVTTRTSRIQFRARQS